MGTYWIGLIAGLALALAGGCGDGSGTGFEVCDDGADNDGDGAADCADSDCAFAASCADAEVCDDGADNDNDGLDDCADPDCAAQCCGNGTVDGFEDCDGAELGGETCSSLGVGDGTLVCTSECRFDFSSCQECGNGSIDGAEECDGDDLGGASCGDFGFSSGDVSCRADCNVEDDLCYTCGDGNRDGPEVCDGANFGGTDCVGEGFTGGLAVCASDCLSVDTTYCFTGEQCTNGVDDDEDGSTDCGDSDCDAECADSCAAPTPVPIGVTVDGTTSGHANSASGSCTGSSAPEVVYTFTPEENGDLSIVLESDDDLGIYVQTTCGDDTTELDCTDVDFGAGAVESLTVAVVADVPVFIVVDGFSDTQDGPFTLTVDFVPAICGDGIVAGPEACDDGNTTDGDACSGDCLTADTSYLCTNATPAQIGSNAGDTSDPAQTLSVEEGTCTGDEGAREQVFSFTPGNPGETGVLSLVLASATDQGIYIRDDCVDPDSQLACVDAVAGGTDETLELVIEDAGVPLSIFIDGFTPDEDGPFTLDVAFALDVCGDGAITGVEECEPTDLDGATCEDFDLVSGTLACDATTCTYDTTGCDVAVCGNGAVEGPEQCEDGNSVDGDGCDASCMFEADFFGFSCLDDETLVMLSASDVPVTVLDDDTVTSSVSVADAGTVQRAIVALSNLDHNWTADVDVFLESPAGTRVELTTDNGGSGDDYLDTVFDDLCAGQDGPITAGTAPFTGCFAPEGLLSDLAGEASMGTWILEVTDDAAGIAGTLNAWAIGLCIE